MHNFLSLNSERNLYLSGLRAKQLSPVNAVLVLGRSQLMGALEGFMAIELGAGNTATGGKLWTMYQAGDGIWSTQNPRLIPYTRLCASAPHETGDPSALTFWVNPMDELTQAAGFGSGWLQEISATPRMGLVLARLNTLMLDAQTTEALNLSAPSAHEVSHYECCSFEQSSTLFESSQGMHG